MIKASAKKNKNRIIACSKNQIFSLLLIKVPKLNPMSNMGIKNTVY